MELLKKHGVNLGFGIIVAFILYQRLPTIWSMYLRQGQFVYSAQVTSLSNKLISLPLPKRHVLVFWTTWCQPCSIELSRINKMIAGGDLAADSVLAVSLGEETKVVQETTIKQDYKFMVAIDKTGHAASHFSVEATPTIYLIDETGKIQWLTSGISPTLEHRIKSFINN